MIVSLLLKLVLNLVPLLLRLIPSLRYEAPAGKTQEEVFKEYRHWRVAYLLSLVPLMIVFVVFFTAAFEMFYLNSIPYSDSIKFSILVPKVFWLLAGFFAGMAASEITISLIFTYLMGPKRFKEFFDSLASRVDLSNIALAPYASSLLLVLLLSCLLLMFDTYTYITDEEIVIDGFWTLKEREYLFSDIKGLALFQAYKAPNGSTVRNARYVIFFNDGENFNFHRRVHGLDLAEQAAVMDFVSMKADVQIAVKEMMEK